MKQWHLVLSVVLGMGSLLAILGFNSPAHSLVEVKTEVKELTDKVAGHDVKLATIDTKLSYIIQGIDELKKAK